MVPLSYYLVLSGILFACGVAGFLIKRNIITIFMSIELMLNGVNLSFVAFAAQWHALSGQVFVFFVMVVAAAEAAVGIGHHHCGTPHAGDLERRSCEPAQTMTPNLHLWLIPLLPLIGAAINGLLGKRFSRQGVSTVALGFCGAAFAMALWVVTQAVSLTAPYLETVAPWIRVGSFQADFAFYLDHLSIVMLLVVTGVGFLIHIYSVGYMWEEGGFYRFFSYLNLFMFFMLTLILASNYLLMFIGWEGVGLASYLLIGFWFTKDSAASAGKKAFIVNRIGDFGFLIALFLLIKHFGSLNFVQVFHSIAPLGIESGGAGLLTAIGLLLLVGACGKSAQIPLYVWLPDAMEGPTPVSALIHAATMVTAGVYMVARSHVIFDRAPMALTVVAIIGTLTALFAATIGVTQTDIKKVLAYSTISQLGYMFMACGVAAYSAGIFHLMTHAFFKGLLFLAAGSVIHAVGGEQDMRQNGRPAHQNPRNLLDDDRGNVCHCRHPAAGRLFQQGRNSVAGLSGQLGVLGAGSLHRLPHLFLYVPAVVHDFLRRISRRSGVPR